MSVYVADGAHILNMVGRAAIVININFSRYRGSGCQVNWRGLDMEVYKNLSGNSGVYAYEIKPGYIAVQFNGGMLYEYTNISAGAGNISEMQKLARIGRGLATFINQNVRRRYARKIKV